MATYFIRKNRTPNSWRLIEESWENGTKSQKSVPKMAYETLGFRKTMSVEEAKARASQLNKLTTIEKKKAAAAARNLELHKILDSAFLPKEVAQAFTEKLKEESFGSEAHQKRVLSHWKYVQKMIKVLQIEPQDYADHKRKIYSYFLKRKNSLDYSKKLLRILNMWGLFVCKHEGRPFEAVPTPKGIEKQKIDEAYQESDNFVGESDPLTPELLDKIKTKLNVKGNYEWLFISVWFGLRPSEVDSLQDDRNWRLEKGPKGKVQVLWVYQSKLTGIEKEKRWKPIPVLFKEQKKALAYIREGSFKRPIYKTIWKVLTGGHYTLYAGRKGFIDLMLDKDQRLEDISMWLGHQNIETTWRKYRNKRRVSYVMPKSGT